MREDKFELTRKQLDMIFLLRIINGEQDKNIKQSDLESRFGKYFTRERIETIFVSALSENLIANKVIGLEDTSSIVAALTKKGKDYISRVS